MHHLVVGGTGFIGLALVQALLRQGHRVSVLTRGRAAASLPASVEAIVAERRDPASLSRALAGRRFDVLYDHLALGAADVDLAFAPWAAAADHLVLLSSAALYSNPIRLPIREDDPVGSVDPYAAGKLAAEERLRTLADRRGLPWTIVRPGEVVGPRDSIGRRGIHLAARLARGLPLIVPGRLDNRITFLGVGGLAKLLAAIPQHPVAARRVYNAGGEVITFGQFLATLYAVAGLTPQVRVCGLTGEQFAAWEHRAALEWHYNCFADAVLCWDRAAGDLGFDPTGELWRALQASWRWLVHERPELLRDPGPVDPAAEARVADLGVPAVLPDPLPAPAEAAGVGAEVLPLAEPPLPGAVAELAAELDALELLLLWPLYASGTAQPLAALLGEGERLRRVLPGLLLPTAAELGRRLAGLAARAIVRPAAGEGWELSGPGLLAFLEATRRTAGDPLAESTRRQIGLLLRLEADRLREAVVEGKTELILTSLPAVGSLTGELAELCGGFAPLAAILRRALDLRAFVQGWLVRLETTLEDERAGRCAPFPPSDLPRCVFASDGQTERRLTVNRDLLEEGSRGWLRQRLLTAEVEALRSCLEERGA
ncbi:MAG: NAD-dependent epimerase/dehydratase family protein [Myxococcota bacterium]|nr:NAD-dependent epimerase/dehydratase family protein [Myxococcota bacterium]